MAVPCVRVPPEEGETTRQALADLNALDPDHDIVVAEGWLYIPVDPAAVPDGYEVVERDAPERETQTIPEDLLDFSPTYERLGDIAILDEDDPDRARRAAAAIVQSDLPVKTVVNRASKVKGEHRVRDWEVLAGDGTEASEASRESEDGSSGTETVHREYGCEYHLDIATVYFSPRLATERHRVAEQVEAGEHAFDMFAGVGPFVIPFAKRGANCVGVDLNEAAVEYLRENARRNGVDDRVTAIHGDVRDVVSGSSRIARDDVARTARAGGAREQTERNGGGREVAPDYADWADRVVMNLPHSADEFLDAAVLLAGDDCTVHYYDIQHEDDPFGPGEAAVRAAAEPAYEVEIATRHVVRSYAPHELNICLDVRLSR